MFPRPFGKYVLERELSRGGMARVMLATLKGAGGFEKKLVVKQIRDELSHDGEFVRRFVDEAKTTVALSHPNIVPVYELGVETGVYFLAMELVSGVSVAELLSADREAAGKRVGLSPEEGAYVGAEVCRALDYAHRRMKVVHRDITPRNVMIDEEGQIKLIDFGIAAPARVAGHEVFGSPGHMPPEQMEGRELGPPTDVFALAVLLMEAWAGRAPFRRATLEECEKAMAAPHPKPSDAHPDLAPLDDAFAKAMRLDPRERQQEADELGRALRAFLKGRETEDVARKLGERVRKLREAQEPESAIPESSFPGTRRLDGEGDGDGAPLTRTFAARTGNDPKPVTGGDTGPSTRKLESERPPKVARPIEESPERTETIATRPIETPARPQEPARDEKKPKNLAPWVMGASIAAVALVLVGRGLVAPAEVPARADAGALAVATVDASPVKVEVASPSVSVSAPLAPVPSTSASAVASPPRSAAPPPSAGPAPVPAPSVQKSQLVLLGDIGTRVTVDGVGRGKTPTRVALDPGPHDVRFSFDPTGESRGERIVTKAGEQVTLRAEFLGASPTVRIQR
ncbi:MAG: protein kinase [Polyangiaceae bacterium]